MEPEVTFTVDINGQKIPHMSMTELFRQTVQLTGLAVETVGHMFSLAAKLPRVPLIVTNPNNRQVINIASFHWVKVGENAYKAIA